jgi:hypothetical protein
MFDYTHNYQYWLRFNTNREYEKTKVFNLLEGNVLDSNF